ncbi:MAG TPA: tripartite tricarboxylate transporter substrate-binding protein [Candidatus Limnocylindria bacterium]|nr:tripartite tricarboxylate transporter substrate-binding protein [Candidatus Limnocylindria bacterium]
MKRILFVLALVFVVPVNASAQAPFYQDKTIRIVAGYGAGSVDDAWTRLIARYLAKHIPGNPNMIVQNMPGAGAMIAANYVYKVAKPDGLTLGGIRSGLYFDQLVGRQQVQFDWPKFTWLGSPTQVEQLIYIRANTPYKTIADVRKAAVPPKCGATGTSSTGYYTGNLLEETLGAKFQTLTGYKDGPDIELAVERDEVQCRGISIETLFGREPLIGWHKSGFIRVLIQTGSKRDPRLADVPTIWELMSEHKTPDAGIRLAKIILAVGAFGRPYVSSPGLPPERAKIIQGAFKKTITDPDFQAQAKERKLEIDPVGGEELAALAREVIAQPTEVVERMKRLLEK